MTDQPDRESAKGDRANYRYLLGILLAVYTMSFVDRQIFNILAELIRKDLGLKDWQLGVLSGLAFAVFYTLAGIPLARLAERKSRPALIAAALTVWSFFTALCGAAQNFVQLALARIGVGIGEGGCVPASHSLIADATPAAKRASAIGTFQLGSAIGTFIGMAVGGLVAAVYGWRAAFLVVGLPGLLLAPLLFFTVKDPRRKADAPPPQTVPMGEAVKALGGNRTYVHLVIGVAFTSFLTNAQTAFLGSFFFRSHPEGLAQVADAVERLTGHHFGAAGVLGTVLGASVGFGGGLGIYLGGLISDRLAARDRRAYMTVCAVSILLSIPFMTGALLTASTVLAFLLLTIRTFWSNFGIAPAWAGIQGLVPGGLRATAAAFALLIVNLFGLGLGPVCLGAISDLLQANGVGEGDSLRWALLIFEVVAVIAAVFFWKARRRFVEATIN